MYSDLNKYILYLSTEGSAGSKVLYSTIDYSGNVTNVAEMPLAGWSGYNVFNVPVRTIGSATYGNIKKIRFTFSVTGTSTTYSNLSIFNLFGYGGVGWNTPSTLAKIGNPYSMDENKITCFMDGGVSVSGGNLWVQSNQALITDRLNEKVHNGGTVSGTVAIDFASANIQSYTITGNTTFSISPSIISGSITGTLIIKNGGNYTVSWSSNIKWADGTAPTLTASGVDFITMMGIIGDSNVYAVAATNFS